MSTSKPQFTTRNIFLRLHPVHRILISLVVAVIVFFFVRNTNFGTSLIYTVFWDVFAFCFVVINWIVLTTRQQSEIMRIANKDDGSRTLVLISILIATIAGMLAVLMLMISKDKGRGNEIIAFLVAVSGMILSWIVVHTLFTFHYAHMYYEKFEEKKAPGLDFPGNKKPDYLDFAYFSFVIGMTFQVSDVEISSTKIRRTVLAHSLLAFALNTFVVALTINLIAGLKK